MNIYSSICYLFHRCLARPAVHGDKVKHPSALDCLYFSFDLYLSFVVAFSPSFPSRARINSISMYNTPGYKHLRINSIRFQSPLDIEQVITTLRTCSTLNMGFGWITRTHIQCPALKNNLENVCSEERKTPTYAGLQTKPPLYPTLYFLNICQKTNSLVDAVKRSLLLLTRIYVSGGISCFVQNGLLWYIFGQSSCLILLRLGVTVPNLLEFVRRFFFLLGIDSALFVVTSISVSL